MTTKQPPKLSVYFVGAEDRKVLNRLNALSKRYGLSASQVGLFALRKALPIVQKHFEVLSPELSDKPEKAVHHT
jgi:hypothetical protein